ncbi:hypothetical protein [Paucibacter sp. XJ19-41]|uniref:hypothetical protein n=1 Tax=Paucibacter sp. XJ19-41 TaxID=2927824 RepID=UPI00234BC7A6|nr:hypothetical protein [Paucibacter sp. XJ19-41]MDC6169586.1 hypothetical protein [Paucibacter sp. XJ19-41]
MHWLLNLLLALAALGIALPLRPWRGLPPGGPPWPWLAWCVAGMPLLWSADRLAQSAVLQPLSGACLLLLMAGWPLAVLGLVPVTLLTAWLADLSWAEALQRGVWLGLLPATLALGLGAGVRRWLPQHLMVYILGRGFFATLLAGTLSGAAALALHGGMASLSEADLMLGRWLSAWGDAFITGMFTAIFVAFRPQWLATYSDRLYLPR